MIALDRRLFLASASACLTGGLVRPAVAVMGDEPVPSASGRTATMTDAAMRFLRAVPTGAQFALPDQERFRWHWTSTRRFPRNGVPIRDMTDTQRDAAFALLAASLSEAGYAKARAIMELERQLSRDPTLYFVSIFGTPGEAAWGWRYEGHHLSPHFLVAGDRVSPFPFFQGAWPTRDRSGRQVLPREEEAARELVLSLNADERAQVVFSQAASRRHETQNARAVAPLPRLGIEVGRLGLTAQARLREIVETYLGSLPTGQADHQRARIDAAGWDILTVAWSGSLAPRQPHYYRVQGPTFLLEFDNSRNSGDHIHSVWRDYRADFGAALLA